MWGINAAFVSPHIQAWDLNTGLSVLSVADFAAPTPDAAKGHLKANGRGIAVVGTRIYYAFAGLPNVYMTDTATHLDLGVAFCTQFPGIGSLSWDGTALWVAPYIPLQEHVPGFQQPPAGINVYRYSPTGQLLATVPLPPAPFYPNPAVPRDDVTVTPSGFVADGGSSVPYSLYDRSGKLLKTYFILSNFRTSGVAFDGTQFIVDNLFSQPHSVSFFDINGNHIRDQSITGAVIPFGLEGISTVN